MPLLDIKNLTVEFKTASGAFRAVDHVTMAVDGREVLAIVGESASGKSGHGTASLDRQGHRGPHGI
jgi:dipeptide transport system ATP-binding protein